MENMQQIKTIEQKLLDLINKISFEVANEIFMGIYFNSKIKDNIKIYYSETGIEMDKVTLHFDKKGGTVINLVLNDTSMENLDLLIKAFLTISLNVKTKISYSCIFSGKPVDGGYRYQDKFQIFPVPEESPKAERTIMLGNFPLMLEFKYTSVDNLSIDLRRQEKVRNEIVLLLNVLLNTKIYDSNKLYTMNWFTNYFENKPSEYAQESYQLQGYIPDKLNFSSLDNYQKVLVSEQDYAIRGTIIGQSLTLPPYMERVLDSFYSLHADIKSLILESAYWYSKAVAEFGQSSSACALFISTSIETLVRKEVKNKIDKVCSKCGHVNVQFEEPKTVSFAKLLDKYLPGQITNGISDDFYQSIRSKIIHGNLLDSDKFNWISSTPKMIREGDLTSCFLTINQSLLLNYILQKGLTSMR